MHDCMEYRVLNKIIRSLLRTLSLVNVDFLMIRRRNVHGNKTFTIKTT